MSRSILMLVAGALLLAGCATQALYYNPPAVGRWPTPEEQQIIDRVASRVIAAARLEGFQCPVVRFAMSEKMTLGSLGTWSITGYQYPCANWYIVVNPSWHLGQHGPQDFVGDLAHELGHVYHGDWGPARASVPQIQKERQADAFALRVLNRLGPADCQAQIDHLRRLREDTTQTLSAEALGAYPRYTERIKTFESGCRQT